MTTRFSLRLPQHQARLVALAVAYHLARPGSEIDPDTMDVYEHGLAELPALLDSQVSNEVASVDLNPLQVTLLSTAVSSVINELKVYPILDTMAGASSRPRSTAPGLDDRLRSLFPQVISDPSYASQLAEDMTMLRRHLPSARARQILEEERKASQEATRSKKPWQFWKRWSSHGRTS